MNGRIYDPLLGRFLSADIMVEDPSSLQAYNRYSYVRNNPLTFTDPTGWYSYWGGVGNMFLGYYDAGKAMVTGTVSAVAHPINTAKGIGHAIAHPLTTAKAVGEGVSATWNSGDRGKGEVVMTVLLTVATAAAPGAEASNVSKVGEISNVASKTEDVAAVGQKAAAVAEKTAAAVDGGTGTAEARLVESAPKTEPMPEVSPTSSPAAETGGSGGGTGEKTFQTYTKQPKNPETHGTYSGRTSGTGTPEQNVAKRDSTHHMNDTHLPAELDKSSSNPDAIRGREQQLIEANGGAQSQGGTSGNAINGVSPKNPKAQIYKKAAEDEFGVP